MWDDLLGDEIDRGAGHMLGAFWGVLGCSYDLFRDFEVKEKT